MNLIATMLSTNRTLSPAEIAITNYLSLVRAWVEKGIAELPADSPKREASAELLRQIHVLDSPIDFNTATVDELDQRLTVAWMFLVWENPKEVIDEVVRTMVSARGRAAADAKHNKPGGSRDKATEIRKIWATGKYTSRDRCAEEECSALGMSISAARRALRNTPDPT